MACYVVGDIHGCFDTLMSLLETITFNPQQDTIYCVGDLVGRGPKPKVLNYVLNTPSFHCTLGNHDLWCLAVASGCIDSPSSEFYQAFSSSADQQLLAQWRAQAELIIDDPLYQLTVVHAGLPPQWSLAQAKAYAKSG